MGGAPDGGAPYEGRNKNNQKGQRAPGFYYDGFTELVSGDTIWFDQDGGITFKRGTSDLTFVTRENMSLQKLSLGIMPNRIETFISLIEVLLDVKLIRVSKKATQKHKIAVVYEVSD